jgi:ABC-type sugar transport system substrate-binding protein
MRRRLFLLPGLVVLLGLAIAAGCGGDEEAAPPAEPAPAEPAPAEPAPAEPAPAEPAPPAEEPAPPAEEPAGPDEYGETYDADPAIIEKALFDATLLPEDPVAQQVALAAFARADDPVDQALALECWQNNGCDTGTGGELTVAYVEPFGENVYREMSKMEFILQALTYPEIGQIIYTSARCTPTGCASDPLADFRSAIAQGADVIVNFPDIGDQYLPVFQEATEAGIPVTTYAWGYVTGPGENYSTVVGEDTCALGEAFAQVINEQVGSGKVAFLGGFEGNPLSAAWQACEEPALNPEIELVGTYATNWVASEVQKVMSSLLAAHPDLKAISYEYSGGMALGAQPAIEAAGIPIDQVWTMRTDEPVLGCVADELNEPNLQIYYANAAGNWQIRQALTAGMMQLKGFTPPPTIVFPITFKNNAEDSLCVAGRPAEASISSLIPDELVLQMYPEG